MSAVEKALEAVIERVVRRVVREELDRGAKPAAAELVTTQAFAQAHAIAVCTVRSYIKSGRLQAIRVGRAWRIRSDARIAEPTPAPAEDTPRARARRVLGVTP